MSLARFEDMGKRDAAKLRAVGVGSAAALLAQAGTAKGRAELAKKSGIGMARILRWTNQADLFRIKGVGQQYADLLEAAGVDTVVELANRTSKNLSETLRKTNHAKKRVQKLPGATEVGRWIKQAKRLPRAIGY